MFDKFRRRFIKKIPDITNDEIPNITDTETLDITDAEIKEQLNSIPMRREDDQEEYIKFARQHYNKNGKFDRKKYDEDIQYLKKLREKFLDEGIQFTSMTLRREVIAMRLMEMNIDEISEYITLSEEAKDVFRRNYREAFKDPLIEQEIDVNNVVSLNEFLEDFFSTHKESALVDKKTVIGSKDFSNVCKFFLRDKDTAVKILFILKEKNFSQKDSIQYFSQIIREVDLIRESYSNGTKLPKLIDGFLDRLKEKLNEKPNISAQELREIAIPNHPFLSTKQLSDQEFVAGLEKYYPNMYAALWSSEYNKDKSKYSLSGEKELNSRIRATAEKIYQKIAASKHSNAYKFYALDKKGQRGKEFNFNKVDDLKGTNEPTVWISSILADIEINLWNNGGDKSYNRIEHLFKPEVVRNISPKISFEDRENFLSSLLVDCTDNPAKASRLNAAAKSLQEGTVKLMRTT